MLRTSKRIQSLALCAAVIGLSGIGADLHAATGAAAAAATASAEPKIDAAPFLGDHYPTRHTAFANGVTGISDVTYESLPGFRPLTLDLYLPADRKSHHPLVLYIHGGGWTTGHSRQSGAFDDFPGVLASLAARGYIVASLNYRLSSEAPFPAAIQDVKAAIKFIRAHADDYSVDKSRGLVWGGSAGGHLAALAALTCGVKELEPVLRPNPSPDAVRVSEQDDCMQAAVTWYGVFDLSMVPSLNGSNVPSPTILKFLNCTGSTCPTATLDAASPIHYVSAQSPPFLLVHGSGDKTVDPLQSTYFKEVMERAGAHADLLMIPSVDHSFIGATPEATRDASLKALHRTLEFIDSTLKPKS
jgi:acetyl esterase/lipase